MLSRWCIFLQPWTSRKSFSKIKLGPTLSNLNSLEIRYQQEFWCHESCLFNSYSMCDWGSSQRIKRKKVFFVKGFFIWQCIMKNVHREIIHFGNVYIRAISKNHLFVTFHKKCFSLGSSWQFGQKIIFFRERNVLQFLKCLGCTLPLPWAIIFLKFSVSSSHSNFKCSIVLKQFLLDCDFMRQTNLPLPLLRIVHATSTLQPVLL